MSLKDKAKSMNAGKGIEFMADRTKGNAEDLQGKTVTIRDYAFITGTDGEYVVFIIDEDPEAFYFGGKVLTDNMKEFTEEEHAEIIRDGLPTKFDVRKSKNKRNYTSVEFFPEA